MPPTDASCAARRPASSSRRIPRLEVNRPSGPSNTRSSRYAPQNESSSASAARTISSVGEKFATQASPTSRRTAPAASTAAATAPSANAPPGRAAIAELIRDVGLAPRGLPPNLSSERGQSSDSAGTTVTVRSSAATIPNAANRPKLRSGAIDALRNERKANAVVSEASTIGRTISSSAVRIRSEAESATDWASSRSRKWSSSAMHIAISTTGRIVVTSVTGTPNQPIAPNVQISTSAISSIGIMRPAGERTVKASRPRIASSITGISFARSRSTALPSIVSATSGPPIHTSSPSCGGDPVAQRRDRSDAFLRRDGVGQRDHDERARTVGRDEWRAPPGARAQRRIPALERGALLRNAVETARQIDSVSRRVQARQAGQRADPGGIELRSGAQRGVERAQSTHPTRRRERRSGSARLDHEHELAAVAEPARVQATGLDDGIPLRLEQRAGRPDLQARQPGAEPERRGQRDREHGARARE